MIVALHGNLGSPFDWEGCIHSAERWQTVDLWREVMMGLSLDAWAEEFCARLADEVGEAEGKPWLVGYSLGGRLALHLLASRPQQWSGAIVLSAHPGLTDANQRQERLERDAEWADKARRLDWQEFLDQWNAQGVFGAGRLSEGRGETQHHLEPQREWVARAFERWSLGHQAYLGDRLANVESPVLWINGAEDRKFVELGAAMAELLPRGEQKVIANCGHRLLDEAPDEVGAAIRDFQKRNL